MKNRIIYLGILLLIIYNNVIAQTFNNDLKISYINHDVPRSPESASFEKYGKIPVGEYTGTANVNVPLYTITKKDINVPINLSYHGSGIRVSQEATWVGLGWDLVPGGRISLEIKGGYDKYTNQYLTSQVDKNIMKYIFGIGNLGNPYSVQPSSNKVFAAKPALLYGAMVGGHYGVTYGANLPTNQGFDRVLDFYPFIKNATQHGVGEPDIFHVNVLGKTFDFYKDLLTGKIIIKGENNLFRISQDGANDTWVITDENGVVYHFAQEEKTAYLNPVQGLYPELTTSWLLTKIVATNGETIDYAYTNYGNELTAPTISESETIILGENLALGVDPFKATSNTSGPNDLQYQKPQLLTSIETKNERLDFILSYRDDIGGMGARKLDRIIIRDKVTNKQLRYVDFSYSYFDPGSDDGFYFNTGALNISSPTVSTVQGRLKTRLKLNSVGIGGTEINNDLQIYRFNYNPLLLPNKVSASQDHWGYYNGANNIRSGISFTPGIQSLIDEGIIPNSIINGVFISTVGGPGQFSNVNLFNTIAIIGHANRKSNDAYVQAGMLTSIVYPTGGWTNFEYEQHKSYYLSKEILGGGLRIKRISNFSSANSLESVTAYDYKDNQGNSTGSYMGGLDYFNIRQNIDEYYSSFADLHLVSSTSISLLSNGNLSSGGPLVAYRQVIKKMLNYIDGTDNGHVIKRFQVSVPRLTSLAIINVPNNIDYPDFRITYIFLHHQKVNWMGWS